MTSRVVLEIALRPSIDQSKHYFMSLLTGKRINAQHWEKLPINDEVIMKVEELAEKEKNQLQLTESQYLSVDQAI